MKKRIVLRPIGFVWNNVSGSRYQDWEDVISDIVLSDELAPALDGIEDFSHVWVIFHLAGVTREQRAIRRLHPRDRRDMPEVGVFATRSQYRPNPIGMTIVRLLERHGSRIRVAGLDAYNGTPVLDIKPYIPDRELADEARVPRWVEKLQQEATA